MVPADHHLRDDSGLEHQRRSDLAGTPAAGGVAGSVRPQPGRSVWAAAGGGRRNQDLL